VSVLKTVLPVFVSIKSAGVACSAAIFLASILAFSSITAARALST